MRAICREGFPKFKVAVFFEKYRFMYNMLIFNNYGQHVHTYCGIFCL